MAHMMRWLVSMPDKFNRASCFTDDDESHSFEHWKHETPPSIHIAREMTLHEQQRYLLCQSNTHIPRTAFDASPQQVTERMIVGKLGWRAVDEGVVIERDRHCIAVHMGHQHRSSTQQHRHRPPHALQDPLHVARPRSERV